MTAKECMDKEMQDDNEVHHHPHGNFLETKRRIRIVIEMMIITLIRIKEMIILMIRRQRVRRLSANGLIVIVSQQCSPDCQYYFLASEYIFSFFVGQEYF